MARKKQNKLLANLGGKPVNIVFKNVRSGVPMMSGILLDEDTEYYYLGENLDISVVVRKEETQMIMDANIPLVEHNEGEIPKGTKFQ